MTSMTHARGPDFSAVFLSLYEEVKKRFNEKGLHATIQTMEKCQAMLLVFLRKGRPVRPYELVDSLTPYPPFNHCKDPRRMVFYVLEKLMEVKVAEPVEYLGREGYYRLSPALLQALSPPGKEAATQITDPRTVPLQENWRRVYEVRNILRLWKIPSLAHSLVYELTQLQRHLEKLRGESNDHGHSHLEKIEDTAKELINHYTEYSQNGHLPEEEHAAFARLEQGIRVLDTAMWWRP
jgi:hypothetical protein